VDKHILQIIVWLFLAACWVMALRSLFLAWGSGEFTYSRTGSFTSRKITRDDNPGGFQLYMIGMIVLNAAFFIVLLILGLVIFS
jgi:hypothetical protein